MESSTAIASKHGLVFFSYRSHKRGYIELLFSRLQAAAKGRGLQLHRGSLSDMHITIADNRLFIRESLTGQDLTGFDIVYFELWHKAPQQALAAATYLKRHQKAFFTQEPLMLPALTKVGEIAVLADQGIPLPDSFISSHPQIKRTFKSQPPIRFPLILKSAAGFGGRDNFLVRDYDELVRRLDENAGLQFIVQAYIPNDCDYRCLVLGGEIKLVLRRTRDQAKDTHLNNTSAGAEGTLVAVDSLSSEARQAVLRSAEVLNRSEFAGVDLIVDSGTGKPYILEANPMPQIEIGAAVGQKMRVLLDYMERRAA